MKLRTVLWVLLGLFGVGAGVVAYQIARSPMTFGETYQMLRFGMRSHMQEDPDYDRVEAAQIETGSPEPETPADAPQWPAPTWTDFRGPGGHGVYRETPIRTDWPAEGLPLVWRRAVGPGYGSVAIADGLVFSLEQRREDEALVAYDFDTGAERWSATWPGRFDEATSGEGPRATPVWADGVLYVVSALGHLHTINTRTGDARTGELGWSADLLGLASASNLLYGLSGSPLIHDQLVIVPSGTPGDGGGCLLALARSDGALIWRAVDDGAAYASPDLRSIGGREQLLFTSANRLSALDPATGELLWDFPWNVTGDLTCSQPLVIDDEHVLLSAGYGKGSALVRVTRDGDRWSASEVWRSARFKTRFNPPVLHEGLAYGLDEGVLSCIDPLTGERVWKRGRYGPGQVLLAGGHLLVLDEDGALALVPAAPGDPREVARFQALEGLTMSIPAAAHGRLLVRNRRELACFQLAP